MVLKLGRQILATVVLCLCLLLQLSNGSPDVECIRLVQGFISDPIVLEALTDKLLLPNGQGTFQYQNQDFLTSNYTAAELCAARTAVDVAVTTDVIAPLETLLEVLGGNRYMKRLYTTLSADEMTIAPAFIFKSDMCDQQLDRNAVLNSACIDNENHWTLKLGAGTGRTDEVVIDTIGPVPFAAPIIHQRQVGN